jgi:hypothetical protein
VIRPRYFHYDFGKVMWFFFFFDEVLFDVLTLSLNICIKNVKKKNHYFFQDSLARRSSTLPNLSKIRNSGSLDISVRSDNSKNDDSNKNNSTVSLQRRPRKPSRSNIEGSSASIFMASSRLHLIIFLFSCCYAFNSGFVIPS